MRKTTPRAPRRLGTNLNLQVLDENRFTPVPKERKTSKFLRGQTLIQGSNMLKTTLTRSKCYCPSKYKIATNERINNILEMSPNNPKFRKILTSNTSVSQTELNCVLPIIQSIDKIINIQDQKECLRMVTKKMNKLLNCERSYILKLSSYGYKIYWNFEYDSLNWNYEADNINDQPDKFKQGLKMKQISDPTSIDIPLGEKFFKDIIENQEIKFMNDSNKFGNFINKYFLFKPNNILVIPILDTDGNTKGIVMGANVDHDLSSSDILRILSVRALATVYFDINEKEQLFLQMKDKREEITNVYSDMLNCTRVWELIQYIETEL